MTRPSPSSNATPSRRPCASPTCGSTRVTSLPSGIRVVRRVEPQRVDLQHPRRVEEALRPDRRPDGRRDGRPRARGGPRPARPDAVDDRHARRCALRRPARARPSARSPPRCSRPATSGCRSARPARPRWCRPTSRCTARASNCPRTRSGCTWPCARPPTSGSSSTCRGCAATCSTRWRRTPSGITVNREAIEEAMGRVDPSDPESMQAMALEGVFTPEDTPQQKAVAGPAGDGAGAGRGLGRPRRGRGGGGPAALGRALGEAFRRRRAAGGPAEQTFAALVGLELRPRRLREAGVLWAARRRAPRHRRPRRRSGITPTCCRSTRTSPTRRPSPPPSRTST